MKNKKLKSIIIFFIILTFISTISLATDTDATDNDELLIATDSEEISDSDDYDYDDEYYLSEDEYSDLLEQSDQETHSGDYFQVGTSIDVNEIIDGNAFLIGTDVKISGQINGDLYVMASNSLEIAKGSAIYGNVYAVSSNIKLEGIVYSLYAVAENFNCEYDGMAALDLKVIANNISFAGYIERHVYFAASDSLTFTKDACILGNLNYSANPENVSIDEEARINGETFASDFAISTPNTNVIANITISFISTLTFLLITLLALLLVKPNTISNASNYLTTNPLKALGIGILAFIVIPILAIIFFMIKTCSIIALVILAIYFILLALSTVIVTISLAKYLDSKIEKTHSENSILAYVLIVGVALWLLAKIPFLGGLITIITCILGLGTIVVSILPNKKKTEEIKKDVTNDNKE